MVSGLSYSGHCLAAKYNTNGYLRPETDSDVAHPRSPRGRQLKRRHRQRRSNPVLVVSPEPLASAGDVALHRCYEPGVERTFPNGNTIIGAGFNDYCLVQDSVVIGQWCLLTEAQAVLDLIADCWKEE